MNIVQKIYLQIEPNLTIMCLMGFIGYPLYYFIWTYLFPQPYESLTLRLICSTVLLPIIFRNKIPYRYSYYLPHYYLFVVSMGLPFFFSYMLIMNDWSTIWVMSFLTSILLHVLFVYDTRIIIIQAAFCFSMAYIASYIVKGHQPLIMIEWSYMPVILFAYIFDYIFYLRSQITYENKVSIAKSFGAGIAHEMRNPLGSLSTSSDIIKSVLSASEKDNEGVCISSSDHQIINQILNNNDNILNSANEAINIILTTIDNNSIPLNTFKKNSALDVVNKTIHSFNYHNNDDRESVFFSYDNDFDFFGNKTLLSYAIYNLMKNAFYYKNHSEFRISITIKSQKEKNLIIVENNGPCIPEKQIKHIFKDFYTNGKNGGFGLGLPFCKRIMTSFGGNIECHSNPQKTTQFILTFPKYSSLVVNKIKLSLIKSTPILYINKNSPQDKTFTNILKKQKAIIKTKTPAEITLKDIEEFDYIFINQEQSNEINNHDFIHKLNKNSKIFYLYDHKTQKSPKPINNSYKETINIHQVLTDSNYLFNKIMTPDREDIKTSQLNEQWSRKSILVVDDNDSFRTLTTLLLAKQGYNVSEAKNGQQALAVLKNKSINLILMDINMSVMNGIETTKIIRQSEQPYRDIPILAHTGDETSQTIQKFLAAGMNDYILKSSTKENMLNKISDLFSTGGSTSTG